LARGCGFFSLLYYLGLLTMQGPRLGIPRLGVPNLVVKKPLIPHFS